MEERSLSREAIKNKEEVQCPTLLEFAQKYSAEKGNNTTAEISRSVVFTSKQILFVKNNIIEQSQSDYWFSNRKGRITASKFYRVFTWSKTLQKIEESNGRVNASSALVSEIMCYKPKVKTIQENILKTIQTKNVMKLMKYLQLWLHPQRCLYAKPLYKKPILT